MGTIATSTSATATAYGNQRKMDRTQNGVLWMTLNPADNGPSMATAYSTDNGTTWAAGASISMPSGATGAVRNGSLFIDQDDYAHLAFKDPGNGYIYYVRGTPNAARTAYTWGPANTVTASSGVDYPDLVVHREGTGWAVHVVYSRVSTTIYAHYQKATVPAGSTGSGINFDAPVTIFNASGSNPTWPSIDFRHTGDGKTVAAVSGNPQPDLFIGYSGGQAGSGFGIRFRKATYSGGSWTWGAEREIDNTRYLTGVTTDGYWMNTLFDGTRVVIVGQFTGGSPATQTVNIYDRDAADTTTTSRIVLTGNNVTTEYISDGSSTYDPVGNIYLFGRDLTGANGSRRLLSRRWVRASQTAENAVTFDATGPNNPFISARRGPQGQVIDYVYTDGTASPYTVTGGRITLNQNPTAPTQLTPADNATWDSSTDQTVTLGYSDPDGNPASKVRICYRAKGTSAPFAVIEQNTTAASGTNVNTTIPAGTWPGDIQWYGQAADSSGAWSDPGPLRTVTGIPTALAALTGGGGGTAFSALAFYNTAENARAVRTTTRALTTTIATVSPLAITVDGAPVSALRNAGYTPMAGDTVQAEYVSGQWIVQDKVVS